MSDDELGIIWWNGLTAVDRAWWLGRANSERPVDAWTAFKASSGTGGCCLRSVTGIVANLTDGPSSTVSFSQVREFTPVSGS